MDPHPQPDLTPHHSPLTTHDSPLISQYAALPDRLGRLGRLVRKELYEILRDRRTIVTLVLMPLLLYPLLSVAFLQFVAATKLGRQEGVEYVVGFVYREEMQAFEKLMTDGEKVLADEASRAFESGPAGKSVKEPKSAKSPVP